MPILANNHFFRAPNSRQWILSVTPLPSNINVEEEDSSIAKTYKDQGLSEASKVLEEEENSLSFGNKSEAEDSIHDLNETVGNLTVSEPKMSASYLSLEAKSPFMLYAYTEDYQKMVAVDLLVQAADKDKFQAKMTKCGRYLHIYRAVPEIFLLFFDASSPGKCQVQPYRCEYTYHIWSS